jgi:2-keto-4-pentenoate hydratase/2-oxohepta-3-ene-1,7-dioic acid hydratase in catechol pathway
MTMKLATFDAGSGPEVGLVIGKDVARLAQLVGSSVPGRVRDLLSEERTLAEVERLNSELEAGEGRSLTPLAEVRLCPPILRPGKIVCLGLNYRDHAAESGAEVPSEPVVFCKAGTSVIATGEPIVLPEVSNQVDYEVELAAIVGKRARKIPPSQAMEHVAGFTVLCDVSARDYQHDKPGGQWYLGKSFDTFCPMGPWLVTADEIPDPHDLDLSCEVSGETMQASNTSRVIFRIPQILAYLSEVFTLEPGDVVATGTPSGVGAARTPPRFLRSGDTVQCRVESVGVLQNQVR